MIGEELVAARTMLGLSSEQFAAELGVTPHVYDAWERGAIAMPRRHQEHVAYRVAAVERMRALAESGLPHCDWVQHWKRQPETVDAQVQRRRYESLAAHMRTCMVCQAREQFVVERFGPMPEPPVPSWFRAVRTVGSHVDRLPPWARPVGWGIAAMILTAAVIGFIRLLSRF